MDKISKLWEIILGGFTSWKTTLTAIVGAAVVLLNTLHIFTITPDQQAIILSFLILVFGWFAKDSTSTGTPSESDD